MKIKNIVIRKYWLSVLCVLVFSFTAKSQKVTQEKEVFSWPEGIQCAVCLTYDDGLDSHLDTAIPELNKYNFKGTFYVTGKSDCLARRIEDWRMIAKNGHELGNHTLFHPCLKVKEGRNTYEWVNEEFDLNIYSIDRMLLELKLASTLLEAIDGKKQRSYGYTCSDHEAGGISFSEMLKPMFSCARSDGEIPTSIEDVDIYLAPSWPCRGATGEQLIEYIKEARSKGTIATLMFHGIGGDHIITSKEAHAKLLEYLDCNRDTYWVVPFAEAMGYIRDNRVTH